MVRSPRNRWSEWTIELLLLLQLIFLGGDETGRAGAGNPELAELGERRALARR